MRTLVRPALHKPRFMSSMPATSNSTLKPRLLDTTSVRSISARSVVLPLRALVSTVSPLVSRAVRAESDRGAVTSSGASECAWTVSSDPTAATVLMALAG